MKHLLAILCCLVLSQASLAAEAEANPQNTMRPYLEVTPVAGDSKVIRVFYSPRCPFSLQYLDFFNNLSTSVPKGTEFEFTPLVNTGDGISYALAFLAVRRYQPAHVRNFVTASLVGVQERHLAPSSWGGIDRLGQAAGLPVPLSQLVNRHREQLRVDLQKILAIQKGLGVTNAPSVTVAGTYIVTPEFTRGDPQMFNQLINAVISMAYFSQESYRGHR
jgi:hypothetical protein